jgi:hypothetical protein
VIARVATFNQLDPAELSADAVESLRSIIRSTPGYVAGFHLRNPDSGRAVSFTVYKSREALQAAGDALAKRPEVVRVGIDPTMSSTTPRLWSSEPRKRSSAKVVLIYSSPCTCRCSRPRTHWRWLRHRLCRRRASRSPRCVFLVLR